MIRRRGISFFFILDQSCTDSCAHSILLVIPVIVKSNLLGNDVDGAHDGDGFGEGLVFAFCQVTLDSRVKVGNFEGETIGAREEVVRVVGGERKGEFGNELEGRGSGG